MQSKVLVVYYSRSGRTELLAEGLAAGVEAEELPVELVKAEEPIYQALVAEAAALAVGSPSYFSNVAWQVKRFIDETIRFYHNRELAGRPFLPFATAGSTEGARQALEALQVAFAYHHKMQQVTTLQSVNDSDPHAVRERAKTAGVALAQAVKASRG